MKSAYVLGAMITAGFVAAAPAAAQDFEWSGRIAAGDMIEIKGVNGDIRARPGSGPEVRVTATTSGRDRDELTFEVVEHSGGITICAVYPESREDQPNRCAPGHEGRMNTDDVRAQADFEIEVPDGVRFVGRTVNGDVVARELSADAQVSTVNGSVEVATLGWARAGTVNGDVTVRVGRADWDGTAEFSTVNGDITITLPTDVSAEVEASTVNGDFRSDFPLTVRGRFGPRKIAGTIGSGGRKLKLNTVNGSISLNGS